MQRKAGVAAWPPAGGLQRVVVGERTQMVVGEPGLRRRRRRPISSINARALGRRHAVSDSTTLAILCHALEQRTASDALALAEERARAHRQHQRHADQPDQHIRRANRRAADGSAEAHRATFPSVSRGLGDGLGSEHVTLVAHGLDDRRFARALSPRRWQP